MTPRVVPAILHLWKFEPTNTSNCYNCRWFWVGIRVSCTRALGPRFSCSFFRLFGVGAIEFTCSQVSCFNVGHCCSGCMRSRVRSMYLRTTLCCRKHRNPMQFLAIPHRQFALITLAILSGFSISFLAGSFSSLIFKRDGLFRPLQL